MNFFIPLSKDSSNNNVNTINHNITVTNHVQYLSIVVKLLFPYPKVIPYVPHLQYWEHYSQLTTDSFASRIQCIGENIHRKYWQYVQVKANWCHFLLSYIFNGLFSHVLKVNEPFIKILANLPGFAVTICILPVLHFSMSILYMPNFAANVYSHIILR